MPLITRSTKGSALSYAEMDGNLEYLEAKIDLLGTGGSSGTGGASGTNGSSGSSGTSGTRGTSGTSGISGSSGTSGTRGTSGTSGTSGVGTSGTSGTSGAGTSGTSGTSGEAGTSGTSGEAGSSGLSGVNGTSGTSVDFSNYIGDIDVTGNLTVSGTINQIPISRGGGGSDANTAIGYNALIANAWTSGDNANYNTAVGSSTLSSNETGLGNTAVGSGSMTFSMGSENAGIGFQTLFFDSLGNYNTAVGSRALNYIGNGQMVSQSGNTAIGTNAGRWVNLNAAPAVNQATNSIFIGYNSRPNANAQSNQIVIGTGVQGNGSNTTTIGSSNTDALYLGGKAGEGIVMRASNSTPYRISISTSGQPIVSNSTSGVVAFSGVPAGGTSGQILVKNSNTSGDVSWANAQTGFFVHATANATYDLPGSWVEDTCRYNTIIANRGGANAWFNTSTYTFTPQKAGYWEIIAGYDVYRATEAQIILKKNADSEGSQYANMAANLVIQKLIYCNGTTDAIKVVNTGGNLYNRTQSPGTSFFQARWICD